MHVISTGCVPEASVPSTANRDEPVASVFAAASARLGSPSAAPHPAPTSASAATATSRRVMRASNTGRRGGSTSAGRFSEADELERPGDDVADVGLDPDVRRLTELAAETLGQLLGTLLRDDSDHHVAPTAFCRQTFVGQPTGQVARLVARFELGDDAPVELAFGSGLL